MEGKLYKSEGKEGNSVIKIGNNERNSLVTHKRKLFIYKRTNRN